MTPGQRIADRFEVECEVGAGGMATVYRAIDRETSARVAVKIIRRGGQDDSQEATARFSREARVLSELQHAAVVRYIAHGTTETGEPYLAMEWLSGEDLRARLDREGLTIAESVMLLRRIADALSAVHARGLLHRDIKPGNIFLVGGQVAEGKLIDFGVARRDYNSSLALTNPGVVVGTPGYMAPEQARGQRDVDARADIFSLGCVLFKCLTGRAPFEGKRLWAVLAKVLLEEPPRVSDLRPEVPAPLDALVAQMLRKDPAARPASAAQVVAELSALEPLDLDRAAARSAPSSSATPGITAGEQRVMAILLISPALEGSTVADEADTVLYERDEAPRTESLPALGESDFEALVLEHGGQSDTLLDGTRVVTFAGAAMATDLSARAARCALALRTALRGVPIALSMVRSDVSRGLPVGEVIDGAARVLSRRMGAVFSPSPLAPSAPPPIAIDEVAAGLLDGRFDVRAGEDGLELHGVHDIVATTRTLLGKSTTFVGRSLERSLLSGLVIEAVEDQAARVVLVTGAAGMGKSRLLYEVVTSAKHRKPTLEVWIGYGDSLRAGSALGLLGEVLRSACGIQEGEPLEARRQKIQARASRHVAPDDAARVAAFLGELIGAPFPDDDSPMLRAARKDARIMSEQLKLAFEDFLDAETSAHPVLLVLDDLHWGDQPTTRFVDAALQRLVRRPWMVFALARPEVHEVLPRLWSERSVQEIRLVPLPRKASEQLVRQVLGAAVSAETVAQIVAQADGNAFYLEELIRAVAEAKGQQKLSQGRLPETVLAMVQARIEGLDPDARRVLRAASVFGEVFWPDGIAALLGGAADSVAVSAWVEELLARELFVRRPESRFAGEQELAFRHTLLREGAYAMLTEQDRELGHRLAGEWLSRHGEGDPMLLAQHFERGKELSRARSAYLRAAEQALRGDDPEAALTRAERVIACGSEGEELGRLRLVEAEARFWRSELTLAEEQGIAAAELLAQGSARWFHAVHQVILSATRSGSSERVMRWVEAIRAARPEPDAGGAQIICLCACADHFILRGHYPDADALIQEIVYIRRDQPPPEAPVAAALQQTRAFRSISAGDLGACLEAWQEALAAFEQAGDRRNACNVRGNIGFLFSELGDFEGAEHALRTALTMAERMGQRVTLPAIHHNLGLVLAHRGQIEEGRRFEEEALAVFLEQGDTRFSGIAWIYLAKISLLAGDLEAAEREARTASKTLSATPAHRAYASAVLARVLLEQGRSEEALSAAQTAISLLEEIGEVEEGDALIRLVYAEALRAAGKEAEFTAALERARSCLLDRAARISDAALRERFLTAVADNARTLALAGAGV